MLAINRIIPLSLVNLMALLSRLYMICLNLGFVGNHQGQSWGDLPTSRLICFLLASALTNGLHLR